tara:strand:+ start:1316 stop:1510 length:195 start_codon:yes stop_codon:yes gene_type:complete
MNQIGESSFDLSVSRVTQSINLDDTVAVEDAYIVVESSLLVIDDGIVTIGEGKTLLLDLYNILA